MIQRSQFRKGLILGLMLTLTATVASAQRSSQESPSTSSARRGGGQASDLVILEIKKVSKGAPQGPITDQVRQVPVTIVWDAKLPLGVGLRSVRFALTTVNTDGSTTRAEQSLARNPKPLREVTLTIPMPREVFAKSYEVVLTAECVAGEKRFSRVANVSGDFSQVNDQ